MPCRQQIVGSLLLTPADATESSQTFLHGVKAIATLIKTNNESAPNISSQHACQSYLFLPANWAFLNGREHVYICKRHNDPREEDLKRSASKDVVYKWTRNTNLRQELCTRSLCPLPADATSQLDVLGHDRHPLGMDCTQISVLKEPHQVRLRCFLQRQNRRALEAQISLEVLSDLPHQSLERKLADEKLRRLLVLTNFAKRNSTRPVPMRLLHTPCSRRRLPRSLRGQLLSWRFPSSRLPRRLLSTSHGREEKLQKENKDKLSNTQTPKHEGKKEKEKHKKNQIAKLQLLERITEDTHNCRSLTAAQEIYTLLKL